MKKKKGNNTLFIARGGKKRKRERKGMSSLRLSLLKRIERKRVGKGGGRG